MAFIEQEAKEKVEEIDAKVRWRLKRLFRLFQRLNFHYDPE